MVGLMDLPNETLIQIAKDLSAPNSSSQDMTPTTWKKSRERELRQRTHDLNSLSRVSTHLRAVVQPLLDEDVGIHEDNIALFARTLAAHPEKALLIKSLRINTKLTSFYGSSETSKTLLKALLKAVNIENLIIADPGEFRPQTFSCHSIWLQLAAYQKLRNLVLFAFDLPAPIDRRHICLPHLEHLELDYPEAHFMSQDLVLPKLTSLKSYWLDWTRESSNFIDEHLANLTSLELLQSFDVAYLPCLLRRASNLTFLKIALCHWEMFAEAHSQAYIQNATRFQSLNLHLRVFFIVEDMDDDWQSDFSLSPKLTSVLGPLATLLSSLSPRTTNIRFALSISDQLLGSKPHFESLVRRSVEERADSALASLRESTRFEVIR